VNPLVETTDGRFVAVDARLILDDKRFFGIRNTSNYGWNTQETWLPGV
jgi:succinyl-CoA synthetase beta subunit